MALGVIGDFLGINKGNATQDAAALNRDVISDYGKNANAIINKGAKGANRVLNEVVDLYGGRGSTLYSDAIGFNGADGTARAQEAFTQGPGYQFQMDQGLNALDRRAAAAGRFSSGNADLDTLTFSQGLAAGEWNNWLDRLTGATDRTAGALGDIANLKTGTATAKLGVAGDVASGLTSANNMEAGGKEANQGWGMNLLSNVAKIGGSFMGYGGF